MSADLFVEPKTPVVLWDTFRTEYPPRSIALDGYVYGGPRYDETGPYLNANHHEEVMRLATYSTAQQILMLGRMGLDQAFQKGGEFSAQVHVNDCDEDVCASWFLVKHIEQAKNPTNPALNRFIHVAGTLDATAGAFPYDRNLELLSKMAWVFEPYTLFRSSGEINKKDAEQYRSVIDSVGHRIQLHLIGDGGRISLDTRYKIMGGGPGWKMIENTGKDAKVGALSDGINAYVAVQQIDDEHWRYTVGRRSQFVPFPIGRLFEAFNEAEACGEDRWGGADDIGGSPRVNGSKLTPPEVEAIVNTLVQTD